MGAYWILGTYIDRVALELLVILLVVIEASLAPLRSFMVDVGLKLRTVRRLYGKGSKFWRWGGKSRNCCAVERNVGGLNSFVDVLQAGSNVNTKCQQGLLSVEENGVGKDKISRLMSIAWMLIHEFLRIFRHCLQLQDSFQALLR